MSLDTIFFQRLHPKAQLPFYSSKEAAGMDLRCVDEVLLKPGEWTFADTGLAWQPVITDLECTVPALLILQRSGLSLLYPNYIMNSPGLIDSDYRGPIKIMVRNNHRDCDLHFKAGSRIAQAVLIAAGRFPIEQAGSLTDTERGGGGFGSTGN
jgi:dUTP pyrophosphatase